MTSSKKDVSLQRIVQYQTNESLNYSSINHVFMKHLLVLTYLIIVSIQVQAQNNFPVLTIDSTEVGKSVSSLEYARAETLIKKELALAKRQKKPTASLEQLLKSCNYGKSLLRNTDKVVVVDSTVVPKSEFLAAYMFSPEVGSIEMDLEGQSTSYTSERGNQTIRVRPTNDSILALQMLYNDKGTQNTSAPKFIEGLGIKGDVNYPFMMMDGVTLYFAGINEEGLGNYDLYVTRFNAESNSFYPAENLGFPYNSYANDYLLVIDEINNVGWFASDRYQPAGMVCIYTFIPNASRHPIDFENTAPALVNEWASLRPIRSTWTAENEPQRIAVRQRLALQSASNDKSKKKDFELVINDLYTYTSISDFRNPQARELCKEWIQKRKNHDTLSEQLETLRSTFASSNRTKQNSMRQQILDLEKRVKQLAREITQAEKEIRKSELQR